MKINAAACIVATVLALPALAADRTPAPEGASAYIIAPPDGATVTSPVTFLFGLADMGVAPAGVSHDNTGHHHLLINVDPTTVDMDAPIPTNDSHRHFGGGQTQATLDLPAGTHTFMLLLGDEFHVPHEPPVMSEVITVTVE